MSGGVFIYAGALLPDGRIYVKVNLKDAARARDTFMVVGQADELYDEAVTHVVSYAALQEDGSMEVKVRCCESDDPRQLDVSTRTKMRIAREHPIHQRLSRLLAPMTVGKQVWLDLPREANR